MNVTGGGQVSKGLAGSIRVDQAESADFIGDEQSPPGQKDAVLRFRKATTRREHHQRIVRPARQRFSCSRRIIAGAGQHDSRAEKSSVCSTHEGEHIVAPGEMANVREALNEVAERA